MNTIPTAKEHIEDLLYITRDEEMDVHDTLSNVENAMIEFAKLHVKAALQAAYENAEADEYYSEDYDEYIDTIIDEDSILNAYPLDQIK